MNQKLFDIEAKGIKKMYNLAKRRLNTCLKYGTSKDMECKFSFIVDMEAKEVHPVFIIYQTENPWGAIYFPVKMFAFPQSFDQTIPFETSNIYNKDKKYIYTQGIRANVHKLKKWFDTKSPISIYYDEGTEHISFETENKVPAESTGYSIDYYPNRFTDESDKYNGNIPKLSKMIMNKDPKRVRNVIDNEELLKTLASFVTTLNHGDIHYLEEDGTHTPTLLFNSVYPFEPEAIEVFKITELIDEIWTTSVALITYHSGSKYIIYYRYIDIWYNMRERSKELQMIGTKQGDIIQ